MKGFGVIFLALLIEIQLTHSAPQNFGQSFSSSSFVNPNGKVVSNSIYADTHGNRVINGIHYPTHPNAEFKSDIVSTNENIFYKQSEFIHFPGAQKATVKPGGNYKKYDSGTYKTDDRGKYRG